MNNKINALLLHISISTFFSKIENIENIEVVTTLKHEDFFKEITFYIMLQ